jgi:hypothetical protein
MRTVVVYHYAYFCIHHIWGDGGSRWRWAMLAPQHAEASYIKGEMRVVEASKPTVIGAIFSGFSCYRTTQRHLSAEEGCKLITNDAPVEGWVLHSQYPLQTRYMPMRGVVTVAPGWSAVVLEGCAGPASSMYHIKPRITRYDLAGEARLLLVKKQ